MGQLKGYLTIIGYIDKDNQATVRLGYLFDSPDTTYDARLRASEDMPIVATQVGVGVPATDYRIPTGHVHLDPMAEAVVFLGKLPLDAATKRISLSRNGTPFAAIAIPASAPKLTLGWTPGAQVTGTQRITWQARHDEGLPLEYLVMYSSDGGQTFRQLSQSLTEAAYDVDFDRVPGGKGQIQVLATDGGNTTAARSPVFDVPVKAVYAMILAPADKARVRPSWVTLQGQGYYLEEDRPEHAALEWTSSIDGKLGTGRVIQTRLSPGMHTITLAAGEGPRQGKATITLTAD